MTRRMIRNSGANSSGRAVKWKRSPSKMFLHYTCVVKTILLCLALLLAVPANAETCRYEGADGLVVYTNVPLKGAKKLSCFGLEGASSPSGGALSGKASSASQPTPSNFPRVDANTQKQRDDARRKILEDELADEQKALAQAKKDYSEAEENPETSKSATDGKDGKPQTATVRDVAATEERMKKLRENVDLHQKNIQMLQKEISGIK